MKTINAAVKARESKEKEEQKADGEPASTGKAVECPETG